MGKSRAKNLVNPLSDLIDAAQKILDPLISDRRVLGPDEGATQDITYLGEDGVAHVKRQFAGLEKLDEKPSRWASRPRCRLHEHHAIENNPRPAWMTHVLPFR